jgi:hypothetical protein
MERKQLFKRLVWGLSALMLALFVFVTYMITRPDAYEYHLEHAGPSAATTWPDGSARTSNDWWAKPGASVQIPPSNAPPDAPQR